MPIRRAFRSLPLLSVLLPPALSAAIVPATAHEVLAVVEPTTTVILHYADGSAMAYADIAVFAPGGPAPAVITGVSDGDGRFTFTADRPGQWRILARDAEGHSQQVAAAIGAGSAGRWSGSVTAISLVLNIAAAAALLQRRRRPAAPLRDAAMAPPATPAAGSAP